MAVMEERNCFTTGTWNKRARCEYAPSEAASLTSSSSSSSSLVSVVFYGWQQRKVQRRNNTSPAATVSADHGESAADRLLGLRVRIPPGA
jgi:hypothetical protein